MFAEDDPDGVGGSPLGITPSGITPPGIAPAGIADRVRESYRTLARGYAAADTSPIHRLYEKPAVLSLLGEVRGKRVLEPGAGTGFYTEWLVERGAEVVAFDLTPEIVTQVRRRVGDRAVVLEADLHQPLSFVADQSVDLVLCSLVVHYVEDWRRLFAEFHRKLRPGGEIVVSTHHPFADYLLFQPEDYFETSLVEDHWTPEKIPVYFYRRPLEAIIAPILEAGFTLTALIEPRPADPEQYRREAPEQFHRLSTQPGFLCLKGVK